MFELFLIPFAVAAMAKIADYEEQSALTWGAATLGLTILALFTIPLPFARILIALLVAFVLLMIFKKD